MHIEKFSNNGIEYLRLSKSHYNKELKKQRRTVVKNLGPLSKFDDGNPDFLKRLRTSFKEGKPIIDDLLPYVKDEVIEQSITLKFVNNSDECFGSPKLFVASIFDYLFKVLGITQFLTLHKSRSKIEYDLVGLTKLMCYGRLLNPSSKYSTFLQNSDYFDKICKTDGVHNIYRALTVLNDKRSNLLNRINNEITKTIGRDTSLVFYDVTNFYFEIESADDDIEDEDGVISKGLRQRGVSKENRKSPIVQMGLFMDSNGIPISFEAFPGNALDQTTLIPAMKSTVDNFELSRFVLVSDRGIMSGLNISHLLKSGHGYIMSKSIKKTAKNERDWILEQEGYVYSSDSFKHKSRIVERTITNEEGKKQKVKQKVVVYWSEKFYKKEIKDHQSFLEFIEKLKENPTSFRVTKSQQGFLKKFMKKEFMNKLTGEIIKGDELLGFIDEDKLKKHTEFYGYYQIVSSELELSDLEIIEKYHGLSQIENQFRTMKSTLDTRPIYVSKEEHIQSHLTICLISLIMLRMIQYMIKKHPKVSIDEKATWQEGMSAERIKSALNKYEVDEIAQGYYRFNNVQDNDLKIILESFNIKPMKKLYTLGELKDITKKITKIS